jgi:hypothetical protein
MRGQRRRGLLWSVLVVCLLATGAFRPARADEPRLDEPGTYLIEVGSGRTVHLGHDALVAWAPDSKTVAVAEIGAESPLPRLRLVPVPDGPAREVKFADKGEINHLRWAPDGSALAFTLTRMGRDPGPALMVADAATGAVRQLVRGSIGEITWTPDSQGITAITLEEGGGSIVTFDAGTAEVRETVPDAKDPNCQRGLAWSPDGAYLAYGGPGLREGCGDVGNWGVWVWQPATRTAKQLFRGAADVPQWLAAGDVVAMVSEPQSEDIPPLSIARLTPEGGEPRSIVKDVPRMFPQPPRLLQVVGSTVLFPVSTCDQGEAYVWSPGRAGTQRQTPPDVYAYRPSLAPDGRSLAYVRVGDPNQLILAPLGPGEATVLASSSAGLQVGTAGPWDVGGDWSPDGHWIAVEVTEEQFKDCAQ